MLLFGDFCYLDVEKSGSTFIRRFLIKHSSSKLVFSRKHARLLPWRIVLRCGRISRLPPKQLYTFTSCRDPFDQYVSLYRYGCEGKGTLAITNLKANGALSETYDGTVDGFSSWLQLLLDMDLYIKVSRDVRGMRPDLIGLQSARFLRLNIPNPNRMLAKVSSIGDVLALYRRTRLALTTIRSETLNADLTRMVEGPLRQFICDPDMAIAELTLAHRVNETTVPVIIRPHQVSESLIYKLQRKEALFFRELGYRSYI